MVTLSEYVAISEINEMAKDLASYKNKVTHLSRQIIENWCLVRWCDIYKDDPKTINRNHWASELKTLLYYIVDIDIKVRDKLKHIKDVWINYYEYHKIENIRKVIRKKFEKEGLEKYIDIISKECASSYQEICEILNSDDDHVDDYVEYPIGNGE